MNFRKLMICLFFISIATKSFAVNCPDVFETGGKVRVAISGFIKEEERFGSPGFGASPKVDKIFTIWSVVLVKPISVLNGAEFGSQSAKKIKVSTIQIGEEILGRTEIKKSVGKSVVITGRLYTATAPTDVMDVVLSAEKISAGSNSKAGIECAE